jgi:hypothetical protein
VSPPVLGAALFAIAVVTTTGARRWVRLGTPVVLRIGRLRVATPEAWLVACVVFWVFFFPTYVVARATD